MHVCFFVRYTQPVDDVLVQIEDGYIMDPPDNCPPVGILSLSLMICAHVDDLVTVLCVAGYL